MLSKSSLCFGLALAVTVGCNSSSSLPTVPVTGKVLLDGTPVSGATIVFMNKDRFEGKPASAITDAEGNFKLATYVNPKESPAGALPGDYDVVITKFEDPTGGQEIGGPGDLTQMQNMQGASKAMEQATKNVIASKKQGEEAASQLPKTMYGQTPPQSLLPERYSKAETSGFTVTVQKGVEPFIFELTERG